MGATAGRARAAAGARPGRRRSRRRAPAARSGRPPAPTPSSACRGSVALPVGGGEAPQPLARPRDGVLDAAAARVGEGDAQVVAVVEGAQRGGLEAGQEGRRRSWAALRVALDGVEHAVEAVGGRRREVGEDALVEVGERRVDAARPRACRPAVSSIVNERRSAGLTRRRTRRARSRRSRTPVRVDGRWPVAETSSPTLRAAAGRSCASTLTSAWRSPRSESSAARWSRTRCTAASRAAMTDRSVTNPNNTNSYYIRQGHYRPVTAATSPRCGHPIFRWVPLTKPMVRRGRRAVSRAGRDGLRVRDGRVVGLRGSMRHEQVRSATRSQ